MNRASQIRDLARKLWEALSSLSLTLACLALPVNLGAAQARRLELSWSKAGIWIVHAGLILLFVGEFVTGGYQTDARLVFEEGQAVDFIEVPRQSSAAG